MSHAISTLAELEAAIESAAWFKRLGAYVGDGFGISVSASAWESLFGPGQSEPDYGRLDIADWLPTSLSQVDPVRGDELASLEQTQAPRIGTREARLAITKASIESLRLMQPHPLLSVGTVDYTLPARSAAGFACRSAATEIVLDTPGFWSTLIPIYRRGNWPFAINSRGQVLIL